MSQPVDARRLLQSAVDKQKTVQQVMRETSERIAADREAERPQGTEEEAPQ